MDLYTFYQSIDENKINDFLKSKQQEYLNLDFITVNTLVLSNRDDIRLR
jgi:hypothetical protein